jgi:hypothetical protein
MSECTSSFSDSLVWVSEMSVWTSVPLCVVWVGWFAKVFTHSVFLDYTTTTKNR